jgi:hypothetical protein
MFGVTLLELGPLHVLLCHLQSPHPLSLCFSKAELLASLRLRLVWEGWLEHHSHPQNKTWCADDIQLQVFPALALSRCISCTTLPSWTPTPPQKEKFIPKFLTLNMLRQMKKTERKWNFVENIDSLSSITDMQKNKLQKKPNYFFWDQLHTFWVRWVRPVNDDRAASLQDLIKLSFQCDGCKFHG